MIRADQCQHIKELIRDEASSETEYTGIDPEFVYNDMSPNVTCSDIQTSRVAKRRASRRPRLSSRHNHPA